MNARDMLNYGHQDLLMAFEGLAQDEWNAIGVTTRWSLKDMLSHLTSYEMMLAEALGKVIDSTTATPTLDAMNADQAGFNDQQVAARADHSPAEILDEYKRAHQWVMDLVEQLGPEKLRMVGTIPWYGPEYSLDDLIVYRNYAHKREHLPQVTKFRKANFS